MKNNIREIRKAKGWTLEALAEKLDVYPGTIQRFESGARNVSLTWLEKIAKALNVSVVDLVESDAGNKPTQKSALREAGAKSFKNIERDPLLDEIMGTVYTVWFESDAHKTVPVEKLPSLVYAIYNRYKNVEKKPTKKDLKSKTTDMLDAVDALSN